QLYAEAAVREAAGERIFLSKEESAEAAELQVEHQVADPWEDKLGEAFTIKATGERPDGWTTVNEVMDALGIPTERAGGGSPSRLSGIRRRLGFEKDPDGKVRPRRWYRRTQPGDKKLLPHLHLTLPENGRGSILLSVERERPRPMEPAQPRPDGDILPFPPADERRDPGPASDDDYGPEVP